jgi:hypothetical protein
MWFVLLGRGFFGWKIKLGGEGKDSWDTAALEVGTWNCG